MIANAKAKGAYYTPSKVAETLVRWVIRSPQDHMLDPSCGDGEFLRLHGNSAGVEQDPTAVATAARRTKSRIYVGDFFEWAGSSRERFDCAAGNPPFIRYQSFNGEVRHRALKLCEKLGAKFSALTASWAPFLVGTASMLKQGGRMAFVVPSEIGHATYAGPLLRYLMNSFGRVQVIAVRDSVFPQLSQDIWFLYAEDFGATSTEIHFAALPTFRHSAKPPQAETRVSATELLLWRGRLRPFLLPTSTRSLYQELAKLPGAFQLGDVAKVGIGYVTGANDFFHLTPQEAKMAGIPSRFLAPTVRNSRALPSTVVNGETVAKWREKNAACLLLRLSPGDELPGPVRKYLDSKAGETARSAYKCRVRTPWYSVPDVTVPDGFLAYMSNGGPSLVANHAKCVCTNSVHAIRMTNGRTIEELQDLWSHPLTTLSTEVEGHPLGGGMLKLEPGEASRLVLACSSHELKLSDRRELESAIAHLRDWRHYGGRSRKP